jgi:uncharacterized protein (DUF1800 family)
VGCAWVARAENQTTGIEGLTITNRQASVQFDLYPAANGYKMLQADALGGQFSEAIDGLFSGNVWLAPQSPGNRFYQLQVVPMDRNALLTTTILNRLAYGPTPDELERVKAMGPDAYIAEQLAPELISESLPIDQPPTSNPGWEYVTATGTGSSSTLYIYLTTSGTGYVDDVTLVAGTKPEAGPNLLRNGGFEAPLTTNDWTVSGNLASSFIASDVAHSGQSSLKLIATTAGTTKSSAIWQIISPALSSSKQYTLSYWYLPDTNRTTSVTVRLSGSGVVGTTSGSLLTQLERGEATIDTLRAWHIQRAIGSKRQLLEVQLQFLENHFVTEYSKSETYFDQFYPSTDAGQLAAAMEFRENRLWRQALLNPQCTFYDLLKISAESPAMIIYLDTVTSRGDGSPQQTANENYARELMELFTFGVNNGYDQNDIVEMSKCWTGWRVEFVDTTNQFNPLAPRLVDLYPKTGITNLTGVWTFKYRSDRHNNNAKKIFPGKVVPDRFGAPYAGRNYELSLAARSGTNGMNDGYDVIAHLANQPFTQEFISVKLCRLLVHDNFAIGYDFTDPQLSPEGQLVRACMNAWENNSPKGQIRPVLQTIFNSELFRGDAASMQKVKTPLEYVVSAVRALRSPNADGTYTADSDGVLGDALNRMGGMNLFDRAEPDGYPESAAPWVSAGTLSERVRFVQALLIAKGQSGRADAGNSVTDPVTLLRTKLPVSQWKDAGALADYFLSILYPAEGVANLQQYRENAVQFLNTADTGSGASAFSNLSPGTTAYDQRVRGMVAMLLTFQRFQEQ